LVERVFADYPDLEYVKDLRGDGLPPNIEICEVFMKTGDYLGNDVAQQNYMSTNYTHIARDMEAQGMNVMAQAIASKDDRTGRLRLSLSSNPDVVMEVMDKFRALARRSPPWGHQPPDALHAQHGRSGPRTSLMCWSPILRAPMPCLRRPTTK
jgi:hypothetical protein